MGWGELSTLSMLYVDPAQRLSPVSPLFSPNASNLSKTQLNCYQFRVSWSDLVYAESQNWEGEGRNSSDNIVVDGPHLLIHTGVLQPCLQGTPQGVLDPPLSFDRSGTWEVKMIVKSTRLASLLNPGLPPTPCDLGYLDSPSTSLNA